MSDEIVKVIINEEEHKEEVKIDEIKEEIHELKEDVKDEIIEVKDEIIEEKKEQEIWNIQLIQKLDQVEANLLKITEMMLALQTVQLAQTQQIAEEVEEEEEQNLIQDLTPQPAVIPEIPIVEEVNPEEVKPIENIKVRKNRLIV